MWGMGGSTGMAFSSRTLSAPAPAAVPGLVVTCIAQGKRGVLSSGCPAWVELGAGPRDSEGHACSSGGSGSGATGLMGCCGAVVEETVFLGVHATSSLARVSTDIFARAERTRRAKGSTLGAGYSILTVTAWLTFLRGRARGVYSSYENVSVALKEL